MIASLSLVAQIRPVGTWKYYCNTKDYYDMVSIHDNLYVNGHRVLYDIAPTQNFEAIQYDRTNGLADYSIATMAYNADEDILIIAYSNTMLDVIDFKKNKTITANFDVFNKIIIADKTIVSIKYIDGYAYLCSKIGIVVFDYKKNEIRATYIIGQNGAQTPVYTMELYQDTLYAATQKGVLSAYYHPSVNLQDFSHWQQRGSVIRDTFVKSVQYKDKLYWMSQYQIVSSGLNGSQVIIPKDTLRQFKQMRVIQDKIYIIYDSLDIDKNRFATYIITYDGVVSPYFSTIYPLQDIAIRDNGEVYVTGNELYQIVNNDLDLRRLNNFPNDKPYRIQLEKDKLYVNIGVMDRTLNASLNKDGMFVLENKSWYQEGIWGDTLKTCSNQISVVDRDGGHYKAYVRGGVSFVKGDNTTLYSNSNSTMDSIGGLYRISSMALNPIDSSIWLTSQSSTLPLHCITNKGVWHSFDLSQVTTSKDIYNIVIDAVGNKWLITRSDGLILFNEMDLMNTSDNIIRKITEMTDDDCPLTTTIVNDMALDKDDQLWVATEKGIGIITTCTYDPKEPCEFFLPKLNIINPNDTVRYTECAFLNTNVNAITVDAGNNLWVGTSDGIFYTREGADLEYLKLNKLNSPFSAKSVFDIAVHPATGEVFASTELGLLSYMGQSVEATYTDALPQLRVIPNPVPREYQGLIAIDGLPDNSFYKITDVLGNLMYQGKSNGSRVTWDGRSLHGIKVSTGVYYIFAGTSQLLGDTQVGTFTIIK